MRRLGVSLLFVAALLAPVVASHHAAAQSYSSSAVRPPTPVKRGFLSGKVTRAESFELERGRAGDGAERFSIVVLEGVAPTDPFLPEDERFVVAPFTPKCSKYFAVFSGPPAADVAKLVGKAVKGAVSLEPKEKHADKEDKSECVLLDAYEEVIAGAKPFHASLWRLADTPANREQIERARGVFEPDLTENQFSAQTPLDDAIEYALRDMKSREALELALRLHMYFAITLNGTWRSDPTAYPVFEKALLETTWARDRPHPYLSEVFWHASSTKALAKISEVAASRPALAQEVLEDNVGWLNASALYVELVDSKKIEFGSPRGLLLLGTEDAFLERHRADNPSFAKDIDAALAASKEKQQSGFDEGWSLVRWVAKNKKAPRHDDGMRVTFTGSRASCCDLRASISDDVDLEVRVDCDAEQRKRYCDAKDAPPTRTATGVVKTLQYSSHRFKPGAPERPIVRVELATATVADGGVLPEPSSLDDVAAVPSAAPTPPASSSGCGCVTSGEPGETSVCAFAVAAICAVGARLARRRGRRCLRLPRWGCSLNAGRAAATTDAPTRRVRSARA